MSEDSKKYTARAISHQELYFSNARAFNDPFDCLPILSTQATKKEFEIYLNGFFERQYPGITRRQKIASVKEISNDPERNYKSKAVQSTLTKGLEQAMDIAGVLSLAKKSDHILMWSHYADSHQGICLKFKVCDETGFFTEAHDVIYQSDRPVFNLITGDHEKIAKDALLTKANFWSYENEVRMISTKRIPGVHKYPSYLLDGIILGAKISGENQKLVEELISGLEHKVNLYKASISPKSFSLDMKKI